MENGKAFTWLTAKVIPTMKAFLRVIHVLPLLWPVLICVAAFTPYIIAVSLDHVYPFLPTISKTAAFQLEGSIFGLLMTFVAFFGLLTICSRYLQLDGIQGGFEQNISQKMKRFNNASLPFGVSCVVCVVVVANFRIPLHEENDAIVAVRIVHNAGTGLLLVSGALYYWFQTLVSYYTVKVGLITKCKFIFRFAVSCIMTITGIAFPLLKQVSYQMFKRHVSSINLANWKPGDGGYAVHVADCAGEWITCLSLAIYAVSFYKEFQNFSIEVYYVEGKKNEDYSKIKRSENDE